MYCIIKFNCDYSLSGRVWARLTCSPTRYSSSVLKSSPQEDTSPLSERHAGRGRLTTGQFGLCPPKPQRMRNVSSEFLLPGLIFWRGVRKKKKLNRSDSPWSDREDEITLTERRCRHAISQLSTPNWTPIDTNFLSPPTARYLKSACGVRNYLKHGCG